MHITESLRSNEKLQGENLTDFRRPATCTFLRGILKVSATEQLVFKFICDLIGGGGGFFLACEDFGSTFDSSFPVCAFFLSFFFLKWRLARAH